MDMGSLKDYLSIDYSTGGSYKSLMNIDEYTLRYSVWSWGDTDMNIDGYTGRKAYINTPIFPVSSGAFKIRISWHTDNIDDGVYGGCALSNTEEFYLNNIDTTNPGSYSFLQGTSMASPHVAGAAALAWNFNPSATTQEIRDAILYSGDYKPQLAGKVMFGSRLNVLNMLQALETPHIVTQNASISGESGMKIRVETNLSTNDITPPIALISNNTGFVSDGNIEDAAILSANNIIIRHATGNGYNLGATLTRMEAAAVLATSLGFTGSTCSGTYFNDVGSEYGSMCGYIEDLARTGIISLISPSFRPTSNITRAEVIKMVLMGYGYVPSNTVTSFIDISGHDAE